MIPNKNSIARLVAKFVTNIDHVGIRHTILNVPSKLYTLARELFTMAQFISGAAVFDLVADGPQEALAPCGFSPPKRMKSCLIEKTTCTFSNSAH